MRVRAIAILLLLFAAGPAPAATVQPWPLPAADGAAQPGLVLGPDGDLLLSWIEPDAAGGHRLRFARHPGTDPAQAWAPTQTIASGHDWFVNWADVPALQALPDGSLWAHLLVRRGDATYAYDTHLLASTDGGAHWRSFGPVHDDGIAAEHGFASLWAQGRDRLGIAWLDGRNSGGEEEDGDDAPAAGHADHGGHDGGHDADHGEGHAAAAMTLRTASFGRDGKHDEQELDARTCDCCQTDSAVDGDRVLLVWRDRSPDEIRDIVVARREDGQWQAPVPVNHDGWKMPGCPVNGPAIAAHAGNAWVAWYTGADDLPQIRIARSGDGGRHFEAMRTVASGERQQGRVDVAADADGVWLAWIEEDPAGQSLWLARFDPQLAQETLRIKVADLAGRGRGTGFPRLQLQAGAAWLAWTDIVASEPHLQGAVVVP